MNLISSTSSMRRVAFGTLLILAALGAGAFPLPPDYYQYLSSRDGVALYWRTVRNEDTSEEKALFKVTNQNPHGVYVSLKPAFTCDYSRKVERTSSSITIQAGKTESGDLSGLFYYPCEANERITDVDVEMSVERR